MMTKAPNHQALFESLRSGDRVALGRAITLVESRQPAHIAEANALLDLCMQEQVVPISPRLAISGAPGVGKSTFIETLGTQILESGQRVAVLAIDPSSDLTGGSILGDKTRMQHLSAHPNAFVRPSPAGTHQGGVAHRTREVILLCATAGFDLIIIETVGVGQTETQVRSMADLMLLLITPGGGDEVQGIKRGILELADIVIINKADGDWEARARETQGQYTHALRLLFSGNPIPEVLRCSALTGAGIADVWTTVRDRFSALVSTGQLSLLRKTQDLAWFDERLRQDILQRCLEQPEIAEAYRRYQQQIRENTCSVRSALSEMHHLLQDSLGSQSSPSI